ncbi:helix-turn-helix domain-containing protein [Streptomyces cyaneofuscatus]
MNALECHPNIGQGEGLWSRPQRRTERIRVTGAEAKRVKREALGVPDRVKHQQRVAVPMQRRTPEADTRQRVYRYRCYPTPTQAEQLIKTFGACRWTYRDALDQLTTRLVRENQVLVVEDLSR